MVSDDSIRQAVAEALNVSADLLQPEVKLRSLPEFDSVQLLAMVVILDEIGVSLPATRISQLNTFGDILALPRR